MTGAAPATTTAPTISGGSTPPVRGEQLTASNAGFTGTVDTRSWQWQSCNAQGTSCADVDGATASSYTLGSGDVGNTVRAVQTAGNRAGTARAVSAASGLVQSGAVTNTAPPTLSGSATEGGSVTESDGAWTGIVSTTARQWQLCDAQGSNCKDIYGSTSTTYSPGNPDAGATLRVAVIKSGPYGASRAVSAATVPVTGNAPTVTSAPAVTGGSSPPIQAETLSASAAVFGGTVNSRSWQWQSCDPQGANCADVQGATGSTYTLGLGDVGTTVRVVQIAVNKAGATRAVSAPTGAIRSATVSDTSPPANTAAPLVTGTATEGSSLTVTDGSWAGSVTSTTRQWQRCDAQGNECVDVPGQTSTTYAIANQDSGSTLRAVVRKSNGYGSAQTATTTTVTVTGNPPVTASSPTVTGGSSPPFQGEQLGASSAGFNGTVNTRSWQWQSCNAQGASCTDIQGATASTYTLDAVDTGNTVRVRQTAYNWAGSATATSQASGVIRAGSPSNSSPPVISGTPREGVSLTSTDGTWAGVISTTARQWQACDSQGANCVDLLFATSTTYAPVNNDSGATLRLVVIKSGTFGRARAVSAPTAVVAGNPPTVTSNPTLSGGSSPPLEGERLSASSAGANGTVNSRAWQWRSCDTQGANCADIQGANDAAYTLSASDIGNTVRVAQTLTNKAGSSVAVSAPSGVIRSGAPLNTAPPAISGTPAENQMLSMSDGTWVGASSTTDRQWQSCDAQGGACKEIPGATANTYWPTNADSGTTLRAVVIKSGAYGTTRATSAPSAVVTGNAPVAGSAPSLSGGSSPPVQGEQLSASAATFSGAVASRAWQWQRCDSQGASCVDIDWASTANYTLTAADVGQKVRAVQIATNKAGSTPSASTPSGVPVAANTTPPTVTGDPAEGATLTATDGTWAAPSGTISRQWERCSAGGDDCSDITGQTGPTYVVTNDDAGGTVRAVVARTNASGTVQAASSVTDVISGNPPVEAAPPSISGAAAPVLDDQLTASGGSFSGTVNSRSWQWQSCDSQGNNCADVDGATSATYAIGQGDIGNTVRVIAVATNRAGSASAVSPPTALIRGPEPTSLTLPQIGSTPALGIQVFANAGSWSGNGLTYSYQWQRCDVSGSPCWNISGATNATYAPEPNDVGRPLRVIVTVTNTAGSASATSEMSPVVLSDPPEGSDTSGGWCGQDLPLVPALGGTDQYRKVWHAQGKDDLRRTCDSRLQRWDARDWPSGWVVYKMWTSPVGADMLVHPIPTWDGWDAMGGYEDPPDCTERNLGNWVDVGPAPGYDSDHHWWVCMVGAPSTHYGNANPATPHQPHCKAGEPVDCATGNFTESYTDLEAGGLGPGLGLSRTYNSRAATDSGAFGHGWSTSLAGHIDVDEQTATATVTSANGSTAAFAPNGDGTYTASLGAESKLEQADDGSFTYTLPDSSSERFEPGGKLQYESDRNGNRTTYTYDSDNHLSAITDSAGRSIDLTYNGDGTVASATDPAGHSVRYGYSGGNLTQVTDVNGGTTHFDYDADHHLTVVTDARGTTATANVYGEDGRVTSQTDGLDHTTAFAYLANETRITHPSGSVTDEHFTNGVPVSVTRGYGTSAATTVTTTYNEQLEPIETIDGNGNTSTNEYDAAGNKTASADALGRTTHYSYNAERDVTSITTPAGHEIVNGYDAHGNLAKTTRVADDPSNNEETSFDYDSAGNVTSKTDPAGHAWTYTYDTHGDQLTATSPEGHTTSSTYDLDGRQTSSTSARGHEPGADPVDYTSTFERDAAGRVTQSVDPRGHTTTYVYDPNGNQTDVTDRDGRHTHVAFDANNQPTQETRGDGTIWTTGFDADGRVASQTDGLGNATVYTYDEAGNLSTVTDPLLREQHFGYDADGNRTSSTDPAGRVTTFSYDDANQLKRIDYSSANPGPVTFDYDAEGKRTAMSDDSGPSDYTYDSLGRLTGHTSGAGQTTTYHWNTADELTSIGYPDAIAAHDAGDPAPDPLAAGTVTRSYDADGRMQSVSDWLGHTTDFAYDADGNLTGVDRPNGTSATYSYDAGQQMTGLNDVGGAVTYGRSDEGLLASIDAGAGGARTFAHDLQGRLTSADGASFAYDTADNLTQTAATDGSPSTQSFDAANELTDTAVDGTTTRSFAYDASGNRTSAAGPLGQTTEYSWDQSGRLTAVTPSGGDPAASYTYDGDGLRQSKQVGSTATAHAYDVSGGLPLMIEDGANAYITGPDGLPIERIAGDGTIAYFSHDQLGSTTNLTNASGDVVASYSYDAQGNPTGQTGSIDNPFQYAGQYTDPETGLQYLRARYYEPSTGQMLGRDRLSAGTKQPYQYAGDDPVDATDPSGLCRTNVFSSSFWTAGNCFSEGTPAPIRNALGNTVGRGMDWAGHNPGDALAISICIGLPEACPAMEALSWLHDTANNVEEATACGGSFSLGSFIKDELRTTAETVVLHAAGQRLEHGLGHTGLNGYVIRGLSHMPELALRAKMSRHESH